MMKIFISYARDNLQRVKQIARELKEANYDIWMDTRNLRGGDLWTTEIAEAISACNVFLLFMSDSSMKSDSVRRETQLAYEKKKKIVILHLDEAKIPRNLQFQLAGIQWIEVREKNWKLHLRAAIDNESLPQLLGKTRVLLQASGEIGVLLVDDNPLARAGWKRVLSKSKQIKVIGDVTLKNLVEKTKSFSPPETIVAGFPFVEAGLLKSNQLKKIWEIYPRVIILAENKEQVKAAFKAGADWSATQPFNDQDLINWVRTLSDDAKRLCAEYRDRLSSITPGDTQNEKFYDLIGSILQLLFHPDLVNPESVTPPPQPSLLSRLVFRNQARDHEFWTGVHQMHQSKYVTVDIYNKRLEPRYIAILGKYLSESHGMFGLIVGRQSTTSAIDSIPIALLENERKVALAIDVSHLCEMLEYKAGGINPVCLLQDQYQKLIASAR